jgi:hypothetical protein
MTEIELPAVATLQIDVGDGCAPGQWTEVPHASLDPSAERPTLAVTLDAALPLTARRALLDARDGGLPLDVALAADNGALYAYTANARDAHEEERAAAGEGGDAVVIELVRLLAKVGG